VEITVAVTYNREQIRVALTETDNNFTNYLDTSTGEVIRIDANDESKLVEILDGIGDRYRYIPGGQTGADDAAVQAWLEAEGL
jgi:hypothetical protein